MYALSSPYTVDRFDFKKIQNLQLEDIKAWIQRSQLLVTKLKDEIANATPTPKQPIKFLYALDDITEELEVNWSAFTAMADLLSTERLVNLRSAAAPLIAGFFAALSQDMVLAAFIKDVSNSRDFKSFSAAEKKGIELFLKEFSISGAYLEGDGKNKFLETTKRLAFLEASFAGNLLEHTKHSFVEAMPEELGGLSENELKPAARLAEELQKSAIKQTDTKAKYVFRLQDPVYLSVMREAKNGSLRRRFYDAYHTAATKGKHNNSPLIEETLQQRETSASLLSMKDFSEQSLSLFSLAKSSDAVFEFLEDMYAKAYNKALENKALLISLKAKVQQTAKTSFHPWDMAFFSEQLKKEQYQFSSEEVRNYFPYKTVVAGLMEIVQRVFACSFQPAKLATWHEDVLGYTLYDLKSGDALGNIYLDLFARKNKQGGAWMQGLASRKMLSDVSLKHGSKQQLHQLQQLPIALFSANLAKHEEKHRSCLRHSDVVTLFHEMGHCLHHLLTKVDYRKVNGLHGLALEVIEFPSQFFERWAWDSQSLELLSSHVDTGEKLPKALYEKMLAAKNFLIEIWLLKQIEYSLIDMSLHSRYKTASTESVVQHIQKIQKKYSLVALPEYARFQNRFLHIFTHGYASGYYSYLWSNVYSADAFALFKEQGIFNTNLGRKYKETFLEVGSSVDFLEAYKSFSGRLPKSDALLAEMGII